MAKRVIGGSSQQVVETLGQLREDLGVPVDWVARSYFPDLPYAHQIEIAGRLAAEVMPFTPNG